MNCLNRPEWLEWLTTIDPIQPCYLRNAIALKRVAQTCTTSITKISILREDSWGKLKP